MYLPLRQDTVFVAVHTLHITPLIGNTNSDRNGESSNLLEIGHNNNNTIVTTKILQNEEILKTDRKRVFY